MNTQQDDSVPRKWRKKWYRMRERFLWFLTRLLRMPSSLEVEQALRHEQWQSLKFGKEEGLGRCPDHPDDPPMMKLQHGHYRCGACWAADYFRSIDADPVTDPSQRMQIVIPTQRPNQTYLQAVKGGAGPHTAALEAIPKWLVRLREQPKEEK